MAVTDSFLFGIPLNPQNALISALLILIVILFRRGQNDKKKIEKPNPKEKMVSKMKVLLIKDILKVIAYFYIVIHIALRGF